MDFGSSDSTSDSVPEAKRCGLTTLQWKSILVMIGALLLGGLILNGFIWFAIANTEPRGRSVEFWRTGFYVCAILAIPCIAAFCIIQCLEKDEMPNQPQRWARPPSVEMISLPQTPTQVQVQQPKDPNISVISRDELQEVQVYEPLILQEQPLDDSFETASIHSTASVETINLVSDVPAPETVIDPIRTRARARAAELFQRQRTEPERAEPVVTRSRVHERGPVTPPQRQSEVILLPGQLPEDPHPMGSGEMRRRRFIADQFEKRKSPRKPYKPDARK